MLIDTFLFNGEFDMLALRLRTLDALVDRFVLVERDRTFSGKPKALAFDNPPDEFKPWLARIRYIKVTDDCGPFQTKNQILLQHNRVMLGLADAEDDDIAMLSDLDEIPDPAAYGAVLDALGDHPMVSIGMRYHAFWLNAYLRDWGSVISARVGTLRQAKRDLGDLFRKQRGGAGIHRIPGYSGWHFSWMGPWERIEAKLAAINESQWDTPEFRTRLRDGYLRGDYCLGPDAHPQLRIEAIDATYPLPLQENPERWAHMIKEVVADD